MGCIAGALSRTEYQAGLAEAGFEQVSVTSTHQVGDGLHSAIIKATKPTGHHHRDHRGRPGRPDHPADDPPPRLLLTRQQPAAARRSAGTGLGRDRRSPGGGLDS